MRTILFAMLLTALFVVDSQAQQYKVITSVESIVPMGIGRSRIIENTDQVDSEALTTERKDGTTSEQGKIKRKKIKVDELRETKLLNFYSAVGINFQNIASNDAVIADRLNDLAKDGWELIFVTSGVESDGGETDANGIFITRYIFRKDSPAGEGEE